MLTYKDTLTLDRQTTTLSMVDEIEEKIREIGVANLRRNTSIIDFEVDGQDLWELEEMGR